MTKTRRPAGADLDSRAVAIECARICDDFKAEDIVVLDVEHLLGLTDFFVIATGQNVRNLRGIAEELKNRMAVHGLVTRNDNPTGKSGWALLDFGLLVVHLFEKNVREFYDLEFLWADAERVAWAEGADAPETGSAGEE